MSEVTKIMTVASAVAGVTVAATVLLWWLKQRTINQKFKKVGVVSQLFLYPIKSCRGISVSSAVCSKLGLQSGKNMKDRVFMLVTEEGRFVTARQESQMLLVTPSFDGDDLLVNAPNMPVLVIHLPDFDTQKFPTRHCAVWGIDVDGYDCGDEAAQWFRKFLNKDGLRLVYFGRNLKPKMAKKKVKCEELFLKQDAAAYADLTPYMMMTEPSVEDLNMRLKDPVDVRNFRPNIVLKACEPYEEDNWTQIKIGDKASFRNTKPCQRCLLTTIDPDTAVKNGNEDPLKTLKMYRKTNDPYMKKFVGDSALLGIGLCIDAVGPVAVGDPVYAIDKRDL